MNRYTNFIIKYRHVVVAIFLIATVLCIGLSKKVGVDYKFSDYLPDDAASTKALNTMYEEYDQEIPNLRVMMYDVSIAEALDYKGQMEQIDGVEKVTWLDDKMSVSVPLEMMDQDTVNTWYKDGNALYQITIDETNGAKVIGQIRDIIGDKNCMDGTAVSDALAPTQTSREVQKIILFVLPIIFLILILTTTSWFEPVLFLVTIGVAIMLNRGTNLMFGTISFVTNAAGGILQLAVSMDYAILFTDRYMENRKQYSKKEAAFETIKGCTISIFTSASIMTIAGMILGAISTNLVLSQLGTLIGRGALISFILVIFVLPTLLMIFDKWIEKTTWKASFYQE